MIKGKMKWPAILASAVIVLGACSASSSEAAEGTEQWPVAVIGQVGSYNVSTVCYQGDRLFFWKTYSDGAMAIHINDATCPK